MCIWLNSTSVPLPGLVISVHSRFFFSHLHNFFFFYSASCSQVYSFFFWAIQSQYSCCILLSFVFCMLIWHIRSLPHLDILLSISIYLYFLLKNWQKHELYIFVFQMTNPLIHPCSWWVIGQTITTQYTPWCLLGQQQILSSSHSLRPVFVFCPSCAAYYTFLLL